MDRIVFFGKGGVGKSTLACNISAALAQGGKRVLHVGCDPKHDSTSCLLGGRLLEPLADRAALHQRSRPEDIVTRSPLGIDCVEAGGPEAGVGCGGRGVSRAIEILQAAGLLTPQRYDVCIFDVLGDVVCGGFAAPLRKGVGEKVVIVSSEEIMAQYAANHIARSIVRYADNGVVLAGMAINTRDNDADRAPIEGFARLLGTRVLGYFPRDALVSEAEYEGLTVVEHAPHSAIAALFRNLAKALLALDPRTIAPPAPLSEPAFREAVRARFLIRAEDLTPRSTTRSGVDQPPTATKHPAPASPPAQGPPAPRWIPAGAPGLQRMARLIGIRPRGPARLLGLRFSGSEAVAEVGRNGRGSQTLMFSDHPDGLRVRPAGETVDAETFAVAEAIQKRLAAWNVRRIRRAVEAADSDMARRAVGQASSLLCAYDGESAWRTFFEDHAHHRGLCQRIHGSVASVHHADLECHFSNPPVADGSTNFFNYLPARPGVRHPRDAVSVCSHLGDAEVIGGGNERLQHVVDALGEACPELELLVVSSTCTSVMTGDDVDSVTTAPGRSILHLGNVEDPMAQLFRLISSRPGFFTTPKRPGSVNLVGLPKTPGDAELVRLLQISGIEVNCRCMPDIDIDTVERYLAAEVQVLYGWDRNESAYRDLFEPLPMSTLRPPPPFGIDGTHRWLLAIAQALGCQRAAECAWVEHTEPLMPQWRELTREATRWTLGFVVDEQTSAHLRSPERLAGVPLVLMLLEMGFQLEVIRHDPGGGDLDSNHDPRIRSRTFVTPSQLRDAIAESAAVAFYSDMYFDRRLTHAGKSVFSLRDAAMGVTGALAMLQRLLQLCRLPFHRTYARYLAALDSSPEASE